MPQFLFKALLDKVGATVSTTSALMLPCLDVLPQRITLRNRTRSYRIDECLPLRRNCSTWVHVGRTINRLSVHWLLPTMLPPAHTCEDDAFDEDEKRSRLCGIITC